MCLMAVPAADEQLPACLLQAYACWRIQVCKNTGRIAGWYGGIMYAVRPQLAAQSIHPCSPPELCAMCLPLGPDHTWLIAGPLRELAGRQAHCQRRCGLQAAHRRGRCRRRSSIARQAPARGSGWRRRQRAEQALIIARRICKSRSIMHVKVVCESIRRTTRCALIGATRQHQITANLFFREIAARISSAYTRGVHV